MLVFLLFIQSAFASAPVSISQYLPVGLDRKYDQAVDKSGDALFVQSGLESRFDMVKDYGNKEAHARGVDNYLGGVLFGYKTYRTKSVSIRLSSNRISLSQNKVSVEIPF